MKKNLGIGILIPCFIFSSVNVGLAAQAMDIPPVIVQPYDLSVVNQQMAELDREKEEQEVAIQALLKENKELAKSALVNQKDSTLEKINDALDTAQKAYDELISLTEDVDAVKGTGQKLQLKGDVIEQKFKILNDLEREMVVLNDKLKVQSTNKDLSQLSQEQADKIQILTQRLGEMNEKISKYEGILAQKDEEISLLKNEVGKFQSDAGAQDEIITQQKNEIAILKDQIKNIGIPSQESMELPPIIVNPTPSQQVDKEMDAALAAKDQLIQVQKSQIEDLQAQIKNNVSEPLPSNAVAVPPIIVMANDTPQPTADTGDNTALLAAKDQTIKDQKNQIDLLKTELESKITNEKDQGQVVASKESIIKDQENQIATLKAQSQDLTSKDESIKAQEEQLNAASAKIKDQGSAYETLEAQVTGLRNRIHSQDIDLKVKSDSIHWLNQVLAVAKNKADYYKLTSEQDKLSMQQVQGEVQGIKDDFARRFKDYDQFENAIASLKGQVSQLSAALAEKQEQVDTLKSDLESRINEKDKASQLAFQVYLKKEQQVRDLKADMASMIAQEKNEGDANAQAQQNLKAQIQDKEDQVVKMKADIQAILQDRANKEIYAATQVDSRVKLAQQLIDLQQQETALLEEKSRLTSDQNVVFDGHVTDLQDKIKQLLANHQIQITNLNSRMEELNGELIQRQQEVDRLKTELENKISEEKDQNALTAQIHDLKSELQEKEGQIAEMNAKIQSGQETQLEANTLKQELVEQENKASLLKQELDMKNAQLDKMTAMMGEYQKKLESKNNAYNEELRQVLSVKDIQVQLGNQINYLNAQVQRKEAEVIKIKKDMYDLQESVGTKDKDAQSKDIILAIVQQKAIDEKVKEYGQTINNLQASNAKQAQEVVGLKAELAMARQALVGMPSSDELEFLREGLKKATVELKEKDDMILQIKANAQEYAKEYKEQSQEFQSLKQQLSNAQNEIANRDEDLKYKGMEVARLKFLSKSGDSDLKKQVMFLTMRLEDADKRLRSKTHASRLEVLQEKLKKANVENKNLRIEISRLTSSTKDDPLEEKLSQAVNKVDEQGQVINTLTKKLQECGQTIDVTQAAK